MFVWNFQEMYSHKTPKIFDRQISGGVMSEFALKFLIPQVGDRLH